MRLVQSFVRSSGGWEYWISRDRVLELVFIWGGGGGGGGVSRFCWGFLLEDLGLREVAGMPIATRPDSPWSGGARDTCQEDGDFLDGVAEGSHKVSWLRSLGT